MNAANAIVHSVTIRNGRFVAVGNYGSGRRQRTRESSICGDGLLFPASSKRISTASAWPIVPVTTRFSRTRRRFERFRKLLAARRRKDVPARTVDHVDGRMASESVGGTSASHTERTRRRGARSARAVVRTVHRTVRDEHHGQGVLRRSRCRTKGTSRYRSRECLGNSAQSRRPVSLVADLQRRRCFICGGCKRSTTRNEARSTR